MNPFCQICEHLFDDEIDDSYRCLICGQECCNKCIDLEWMICKECDTSTQTLPSGNIEYTDYTKQAQNSRSGTNCGHCGKEIPSGLDYFRVTKVYHICRECGGKDAKLLAQSEVITADIDWRPIEELVITPDMENWGLLLYVEQKKLCALKIPIVVTATIVNGKIDVCSSHKLSSEDWRLSTITHFVWLNEPE